MSANPLPQTDSVVYTVSQWKEMVDERCKWWQKAFYKFAYCPFNELALRVFKIPRPTEVAINGKEVRFRWWEIQGHFASADEARIACTTPRHCFKDYPFGRRFPDVSGQIGNGPIFPLASNPHKRIQPIMDTTFMPRREVNQLRSEVARLNKVLD